MLRPLSLYFQDGSRQPLSSTDTRTVDTEAGVIHFRPIHRDEDGSYKCTAINDAGEDSATGQLNVIGQYTGSATHI